MKRGLGLYRHMLTPANFRFARQAGATAIVAHLLSYFGGNDSPKFEAATSDGYGFGVSDNRGKLWTYEQLRDLRLAVEAEGLELIECGAAWHAGMAYALGWMNAAMTMLERE